MFPILVYFRRIYMESLEHNNAYISTPICTNRLIFRKCTFFLFFSGYSNYMGSHNFTNLVFVTSSPLFSITIQNIWWLMSKCGNWKQSYEGSFKSLQNSENNHLFSTNVDLKSTWIKAVVSSLTICVFNSWVRASVPWVIAGTEICKWVTHS